MEGARATETLIETEEWNSVEQLVEWSKNQLALKDRGFAPQMGQKNAPKFWVLRVI